MFEHPAIPGEQVDQQQNAPGAPVLNDRPVDDRGTFLRILRIRREVLHVDGSKNVRD